MNHVQLNLPGFGSEGVSEVLAEINRQYEKAKSRSTKFALIREFGIIMLIVSALLAAMIGWEILKQKGIIQ